MTITDEMVRKAMDAYAPVFGLTEAMRAALEAVAPMLIAQGVREAAIIVAVEPLFKALDALNARAQELDPK